jgi:hypothetical protein
MPAITGALLPYTAEDLLEEACSRAGIAPEQITGEIVYKALTQLNLLLTQLMNRGFQLWMRQQVVLPCYEREFEVPLPPGVNLVTTLNRRTLQRMLPVTSITSDGGDASLAFDDDFDTACVQTAANGSITAQFDTATKVDTVGVLSGGPGVYAFFYEWSNDNVTWNTISSTTVTFTGAREWEWVDLQGGPVDGALFWRVRSSADVPFTCAELFFGNNAMEINLGPWNLDDYSSQPNKYMPGQVLNWYMSRDISAPTLYVWPMPDRTARYDTLVTWSTQYLDQIEEITQSLPVPARWFDAITACMARRLCRSLKEADMKRYEMLVGEEKEAMFLAESEERDPAPTNYDLGVSAYTA